MGARNMVVRRSVTWKEEDSPVVAGHVLGKYFGGEQVSGRQEGYKRHPVLSGSCNNEYNLAIVGECDFVSSTTQYQQVKREHLLSESLKKELTGAQAILDLPPNWDGEGSRQYRRKVLERAFLFTEKHARWFHKEFGKLLDTPHIGPGPDGSIDVHWSAPDYELLVNIPDDLSMPGTYYGDDYDNSVVKGSFDPTKINRGFLQLWKP